MAVSTVIPLASWALLFGFFHRGGMDWRIAFLSASVFWGVALTLITEILSVATSLHPSGIAAAWTCVTLVAALFYKNVKKQDSGQEIPFLASADKPLVLAVAVILTCTFLIAILAPPNSWDSMTYHMSRVMHWLQQGSVAHFPTNILRQVELNPWAEFAILHLQALSGTDYLANLVQWFSMAGSIVGVTSLASLFGASVRGQLLAAFFAATIPMALLQSSSTQNDLVVSFWLVAFVVFGVMSVLDRSPRWMVLMSLSLGLAILTKGTAYIFAFPFVIWFFVQDLKMPWRQVALKYLFLSCMVLALNLGHYQRNYQLFKNPLSSGSDPFSNSYVTAGVVLSNVSRNISLHLWTPSHGMNGYLVSAVNSFHSALGVGSSDQATTWPGTFFDNKLSRLCPFEDTSGNPLHFCLFVVVSASVLFRKNFRALFPYTAAVTFSCLLFCVLLRWQPWSSRLHLPLFLLYAPVAAVVVSQLRQKWIERALVAVFALASLPWLFCNMSRPLISLSHITAGYPASILETPRRSAYFARSPGLERSFLDVSARIVKSKFRQVGISCGADSLEYPLWVLTREARNDGPRIEHVNVKNVSRLTGQQTLFQPDVVVVFAEDGHAFLAAPTPENMSN